MKIGYARVSTEEQSDGAQLDALQDAGCERVYQEKGSGKSRFRPELERMTDSLRAGDVVVVQRLDRLGRSLRDLIELLDSFKEQNVQFISLNESIDTTTAVGGAGFSYDRLHRTVRKAIDFRANQGWACSCQSQGPKRWAQSQTDHFRYKKSACDVTRP